MPLATSEVLIWVGSPSYGYFSEVDPVGGRGWGVGMTPLWKGQEWSSSRFELWIKDSVLTSSIQFGALEEIIMNKTALIFAFRIDFLWSFEYGLLDRAPFLTFAEQWLVIDCNTILF